MTKLETYLEISEAMLYHVDAMDIETRKEGEADIYKIIGNHSHIEFLLMGLRALIKTDIENRDVHKALNLN